MTDTILVLGAGGQLGGEFVRTLNTTRTVVSADVEQIDVRNPTELGRLVRDVSADTIINCTAWNGVDQAEQNPVGALATNAVAVRTLSMLAAKADATLVHFSTDFVFDGAGSSPYVETDWPNPLSTYGMSKLLGEMASEAAPKRYILRLSSLYGGPQRRSYIDCIAGAIQAGSPIQAYVDRIVSPSFIPDVVHATLRLLEARAPYGLYHCASSDVGSWYDMGLEIARQLSLSDSCVQPVRFSNQPGRARRPRYCALSTKKLAAVVGPTPSFKDGLRRHLAPGANAGTRSVSSGERQQK